MPPAQFFRIKIRKDHRSLIGSAPCQVDKGLITYDGLFTVIIIIQSCHSCRHELKQKALIRSQINHCMLLMHRLCYEQEHVLQVIYQAERLPDRSCSGSIRSPGT